MDLSLAWAPYLGGAALMLALGAWLLVLDAGNLANRTFAALVSFRAIAMAMSGVRSGLPDEAMGELLLRLLPYALLPLVPLALVFVSVYPRRRWFGALPGGLAGLVVAAVLLDGAYLVAHDALWTYATAIPGAGLAAAGSGLAFTSFGPLALVIGLQHVAFGVVGLVFAHDALGERGSRRFSAVLLAAGFTLNALFDGTLQAVSLAGALQGGETYPWAPWGWALVVLPPLALVPAIVTVALFAGALRSPGTRPAAVRVLAVAPFPVATAIALATVVPGSDDLGLPVSGLLIGLWRLALPLLVTYALVRHQLFDIDVKVKAGIRASTVAFAFLAVFFTVSELAANLIQEQVGTALGIAAAVTLAFALKPVERAAERLAHRIMPGTKPVQELTHDERLAFYREQLDLAAADGVVGEKEQRMLARLRDRLGLDARDMAALGVA